MEDLIAQDPYADVGPDGDEGRSRAAGAQCRKPVRSISPRIVAIPVFDTGMRSTKASRPARTQCAIVNILGFFVERHARAKDVVGRIS